MIVSLFLSLLLPAFAGGAPANAAPAPTATPLKVIINLRSRAICTTLHDVVLPFVVTEKTNNERLKTMDKQYTVYKSWKDKSSADLGANGTNTPNGAALLAAANMDHNAAMMYQDLSEVEDKLAASYRRTPTGKNAEVDALRRRVENIVKLQYAMASRYEEIAGKQLDSLHATDLVMDPAYSSQMLIPDYNNDPLDNATPIPAGRLNEPGTGDALVDPDYLNRAPNPDIAKSMVLQEYAFVKPALAAVNTCDPADRR